MSRMIVHFVAATGHPLGAVSTTAPGSAPPEPPSSGLMARVPVGKTSEQWTLRADEVAVAVLDAPFSDPVDVHGFVIRTDRPPGEPVRRRLEPPSHVQPFSVTHDKEFVTIEAARLGAADRLAYEIRADGGWLATGVLEFGQAVSLTVRVKVDKSPPYTVLVEGYAPTRSQQAASPVQPGDGGIG